MNTQQLKAVYQLAEMHHNADPKNAGKKHDLEVSRKAYEDSLAADQLVETEGASETLDQAIAANEKKAPADDKKEDNSEPKEAAQDLSIEELEELLKEKKAAKKITDAAEKEAAKKATEAATLAAKAAPEAVNAGNGSTESEDSKKNENPS